MSSMVPTRIFWGESYDHAGGRLCTREQLRSSFLAYMLLADEIIIHPVAMWQCELARSMLLQAKLACFGQPKAKLLMSRDETVVKYMRERIPHLESIRAKNPEAGTELLYYLPYREVLLEESALLDDLFPHNRGVIVASWDKPFTHRRLILQELSRPHEPACRLGNIILSFRGAVSKLEAIRCIERIAVAAADPNQFFSTDVVLFELTRSGFSPNPISEIRKRLSIILLKVNTGVDIHTPLVSKFDRGVLDPLSPEVFWHSMECLIGKRLVKSIISLDKRTAIQVCSDICGNPEWSKFVSIYIELVTTISDELLGVDEKLLRQRLNRLHPGFFHYWWSLSGRTSLVALICGMISAARAVSADLIGTGSLVLSMTVFAGSVIQSIYQYLQTDKHRLFFHVRKALGSDDPYKRLNTIIG